MPTLDETTLELLDKVRKGTTAKFVLINKGVKILNLIVFRKGDVDGQVRKAKAAGTGDAYVGVVVGSGVELRFLLSAAEYPAPPGRELILKDFLKTAADLRLSSVIYELVPEPTAELLHRGEEVVPLKDSVSDAQVPLQRTDSSSQGSTPPEHGELTQAIAQKMALAREKLKQWFVAFQLGNLPPDELRLAKHIYHDQLQVISRFLQGNDDLLLSDVLAAQKSLNAALRKESLTVLGVRERWERLRLDVDTSIEALVTAVGRLVPAERPEELRTALRKAMQTPLQEMESALSPLFKPEQVTAELLAQTGELVGKLLNSLRDNRLFRYLSTAPGALQIEGDPGSTFQAGVSAIESRLVGG